MGRHPSCTIYVGNLPLDVKDWEVEDLFYKYGRVVDIEMKLPPRPPGYCFVEFDDPRSAQDAIRGRDGYNFDGCLLRVELSHGGSGGGGSRGRSPVARREGNGGARGGDGSARVNVSRCTDYRVIVRGLPPSASWQDLKDYMRKAGDVCFVQVFPDGDGALGIVDYTNYEDMQYAIRKMDDTEFRNPWCESYIRVKAHQGSPPRNRSRSRSPIRARSGSLDKRPRFDSRARFASPARPSRPRSLSPQ